MKQNKTYQSFFRTASAVMVAAMLLTGSITPVFAARGIAAGVKRTNKLSEADSADFTGAGTVIALIDTGFTVDHPLFQLSGEGIEKAAIDKEESDAFFSGSYAKQRTDEETDITSAYVSEKIPFAFDYTDGDTDVSSDYLHGTYAAGIIGAYRDPDAEDEDAVSVAGAAPDAQLLFLKAGEGAFTDAPLDPKAVSLAIRDAIHLGANIIYINNESSDEVLSTSEDFIAAVTYAHRNGVLIIAGAGDKGIFGGDNIYSDAYVATLIPAYLTDNGTVSSLSRISGITIVNSADNPLSDITYFAMGSVWEEIDFENETPESLKGRIVSYTDTNTVYGTTKGLSFARYFDGQTLSYVHIGGVGKESDYADSGYIGEDSLKDKIVLVSRGEISFMEKTKIAAAHGALAVIVYDNDPETNGALQMDLTGAALPAIFIDMENGALLRDAEEKTIVFPISENYAPNMSAKASFGAASDGNAAVDITAYGDLLMTVSPSGGTTTVSGSYFAAAAYAGEAARVMEYLKENEKSGTALATMTTQLLAASAELAEFENESGVNFPVSPRYQGAGVADADAAIAIRAAMTSDENNLITSFGDSEKLYFTLPLTIYNYSDTDLEGNLYAEVTTDGYAILDRETLIAEDIYMYEETGYYMDELLGIDPTLPLPAFLTGESIPLAAKVSASGKYPSIEKHAADFAPLPVKISAGKSTEITLTIAVDREAADSLLEHFTNGFFLDAYITLDCGDFTLHHAGVGYVGDWNSQSAVSSLWATDGVYTMDHFLFTYPSQKVFVGDVRLGQNYMLESYMAPMEGDDDLFILGPTLMDGGSLNWQIVPLRNIVSHTVEIQNEAGKQIYYDQRGAIKKSMQNLAGNLIPHTETLWNCRAEDNFSYIYPDGTYTCTITLVPEYGKTQTFTFDFRIDTKAPILEKYEFFTKDGQIFCKATVSDNLYLQQAKLYDSSHSYPMTEGSFTVSNVIERGEGTSCEIVFDITLTSGTPLYLELYDFGFNLSVFKLKIPTDLVPEIPEVLEGVQ